MFQKENVPKGQKNGLPQRSKFGHIKLPLEVSHNEPIEFKNFLRMDFETYNHPLCSWGISLKFSISTA